MGKDEKQAPKEVVTSVLTDFYNMNKCAIIHSEFQKFLDTCTVDVLSVQSIRDTLTNLEAVADQKLIALKKLIDS